MSQDTKTRRIAATVCEMIERDRKNRGKQPILLPVKSAAGGRVASARFVANTSTASRTSMPTAMDSRMLTQWPRAMRWILERG